MPLDATAQIYPWQQQVWDTLTGRFPQLGHGLLFYGKKGCGKEAFTQQFLAWVLCQNRHIRNLPCGECGSCQWLKADTHPNYVYISTDEDNKKQNAKIKIEKIRGRTPWGPQMSEAMHGAAIQHVLTKTVRDSAAMLDATHGEDHHSMFKIERPHTHYLEIIQQPPKKLKIAFNTKSPIGTKISKDAVQAIDQTVKLLESSGHEVIEDHPAIDGMQLAKDFITTWFSQFSYMLEEIRRQYPSKSTDFELDSLVLSAFGAKTTAIEYIQNLNNWGVYVSQMNHFFDCYDLYLTPATASVAPRNGEVKTPAWQKPIMKALLGMGKAHLLAQGKLIDQIVKENLKWVPFTQLSNITGLPAMSVPLYWNEQNLPLGSQFIAPFAREDLLLQLAAQLEEAQPWFNRYKYIQI